jgi:hypothetical protein
MKRETEEDPATPMGKKWEEATVVTMRAKKAASPTKEPPTKARRALKMGD